MKLDQVNSSAISTLSTSNGASNIHTLTSLESVTEGLGSSTTALVHREGGTNLSRGDGDLNAPTNLSDSAYTITHSYSYISNVADQNNNTSSEPKPSLGSDVTLKDSGSSTAFANLSNSDGSWNASDYTV